MLVIDCFRKKGLSRDAGDAAERARQPAGTRCKGQTESIRAGRHHHAKTEAGAGGCRLADEAAKQNPYSKLFKIVNHYCLMEVNGDTCTFKAMTPDGQEIDSGSWKARQAP